MRTILLIATGLLGLAGCATPTTSEKLQLPPLRTEEQVDVSRYLGTWFEIASFPQRFQKGCTGTTATYVLRRVDAFRQRHRLLPNSRHRSPDLAEKLSAHAFFMSRSSRHDAARRRQDVDAEASRARGEYRSAPRTRGSPAATPARCARSPARCWSRTSDRF